MKIWESQPLGELCSLITDGKHGDCDDEENSGFYFISAKDIRDGHICYDNARQIAEADFAETHRRTNLCPGDILLTNSGTIGRLAIATDDDVTRRTTFQKSVAVLKPKTGRVDSRFLYHFLAGSTDALVNAARGAAQTNLLLSDLRRIPVVTPPQDTQRRIAEILASYDDLLENNARRIKLLEDAARLLYEEWFVRLRFPGHEHTPTHNDLPEGWQRKAFGDLCQEVREQVQPENVEPDTPYIGLEHMPRRSITLGTWGRADDVNSTKHRYLEGDILFGKIRAYFHKVGIAMTGGITSSDTIVIRANDDALRPIVLMAASSDHFVNTASQTAREGSKMPRADWKVMQAFDVLVPHDGLLDAFNQTIEPIVAQLRTLTFQSQKGQQARDLLLPRLMNGEIAV